jgi:hypothetical protein
MLQSGATGNEREPILNQFIIIVITPFHLPPAEKKVGVKRAIFSGKSCACA